MDPPWLLPLLLLLLPLLLRAQETTDSSPFADNSTNPSNSTGSAPFLGPTEGPGSSDPPPTEEDDEWIPAETFLFTGDPSSLGAGRCSRTYGRAGQSGAPPPGFAATLRPALDALASTANFLNMIFQASDLRESTVREDLEWYHALVRALLEADVHIRQALLTFDAEPAAPTPPQLVLRAARDPAARAPTILLQDLTRAWDRLHPLPPAPDDAWFTGLKFPAPDRPAPALSKRLLLNDLSTLDTPKWRQGDGYVSNRGGVRWGSAPFLDCQGERFVPRWMLTLSTAFYGLKPDLTPEFRGVIRVDVDVQDLDLDQCSTGDTWFADTHQCNRTTMECVPVAGRGFRLGQYCCRCKEGFYNPELTLQEPAPCVCDTDGRPGNASDGAADDDEEGGGNTCYPNMPVCLPCWPGCTRCEDGAPCWVQEDWLLRAAVLGTQGVFMLLIFVSMMAAFRHRRNRRIRASGLLLLETILFGSLLLYFPVFILYFKPSTFRCILLRWVRMLGFSIVYGTVTLKMYRVLKVFLSRTAQRVPYMSSLHLLRILGVMLMTVSWFLCAWTVGVLQNRDRNIPVFTTTATTQGQGFNLCYLDRWDYMMAVAELLFLCWGSSLWTAVRPVPSAFHEPRYMGIAIHNELLLSSMFHLLRFTFPSLHPDWMLLLSFAHTHVTITVTLALLFIPKFLHVSKPGREEIAAEVYEDEVDLRRSYLNSSFHSAWSEHSVDPDDFRDELKKLYAQLEVHKTKKMAANNPHLTKKRSSRCALGRSIIKRIAEIPESMSRQCSREERDGSFRSRSVNMSDSFRQTPDTVSISYRSSMRSPSPSMRKSQSDYHYIRSASPRGSILKSGSSKRASQRSHTDSLDIPPGVCKSASAQNLTIDANLLHPDHTRLHKSWSLTSTTTHSMENVSKVNRAGTVVARSGQNLSIGDQTRSALQSESFDKAEVCPWEVEQEVTADKNQKHVTYANSEDNEVKRPPSPQALVCPWEFLPPVEKIPSEDKGQQAEAESPKQQAPVSASAPGSPRPKFVKDQRVFSLRSATTKWLSVKSFMGSMDAGSRSSKEGNLNIEDSVSQKSQDSATTTPRSGSSSRRPSMEKRALQKRSMTTVDGKPHLVKQNAIRLSSGDSSDRSPRRLVIVKSAVHPWDADEMQKDGTYENVFLSRQNSKRSSISSWDTASSSRTPSTHRRGSYRITPVRNVSHADVCPWEVPAAVQEGQGPQRQQSFKADVCPWESQDHEGVRRQGSGRANVCPWELADALVAPQAMLSTDSQRHLLMRPTVDICPWESTETAPTSKRRDSEYTNICPWDVQDKPEVVYENLNPLETKGSLRVPSQQEGMKTAIYPGTSKEPESTEKKFQTKSPVHDLGKQLIKSCPWEFPDPPQIVEVICPGDKGNPGPTDTDSASRKTIKVDVCPWDSGDQDKPGDSQQSVSVLKAGADRLSQTGGREKTRVNVCPWETEPPAAAKTGSQGPERPTEVCPWETEGQISGQPDTHKTPDNRLRQDIARENVCPWDTEALKPLKKQDSSLADVCPWETGETDDTKVAKKQDSLREDVCPWETEEPKVLKKQESSREDVCPWEKEEPKVLKKQDSSKVDVCPWDTEKPKVLKKQDSSREDVCPWETEEPKVLKKQDSSRADICPWDTEEPKILKKQDSSRTNVCPWDTEEPKVIKKQDSSREDVCPWDTEEPKVLKKQASSREDVCPWDTEEPKVLKKQDSSRADVCPWDTEEPKVLRKQDSSRADVCPWDTEEPKVLKRQDSSRANVCPWETEEPGSPTNQDGAIPEVCLTDPGTSAAVDLPQSGTEEVSDNLGPRGAEHMVMDADMQQSNTNLALGRRDALCPWELTRSRSGSFTDNTSDVFTWEPENIPEEDEEDDAECAAEALVFPPDL